jgi:hypothetical protein
MEPGDPNQIEDELIMMLLGIFTHAILGLIETKREADPHAEFELSAVDVLEYILNLIPIAGMIFILQAAVAAPSTSDRHVGSQDTTTSSPSTAGYGAVRNVLKNADVESMDADW